MNLPNKFNFNENLEKEIEKKEKEKESNDKIKDNENKNEKINKNTIKSLYDDNNLTLKDNAYLLNKLI